ncbi:hypothetical protein [Quadrisphaera setariae]|uniref:hypothetical protein n=1 Tax=Quadrisphaera setariae TaxID=2593304 RepID=UPI001C9BD93F|nr:hypothetical protein [Quadrisphaera setariae]
MTPTSPADPGRVDAEARTPVPGEVLSTTDDTVIEGRVLEPVDVVAAAVLAVPGVAALHSGPLGGVATFLPGRRVAGVALREDGTSVHLVLETTTDIRATAQAVHRAVEALGPAVAPQPVHVHVEDLAAPAPRA